MKRVGKVKTLAIAALSAVPLAAPIAIAQNPGTQEGGARQERGMKRGGHRGGHFGGREFRGLDLTEEQQTRIGQLRQSFGERTRPLREQLRAKRQELRQASEGGTFSEALATQKLTESAAIEALMRRVA